MLTKRQRDRIPIGIERFNHERPMQVLGEAERQLVEAAMSLREAMNGLPLDRMGILDCSIQLTQLDYACEVLAVAQNRVNDVPPIPDWVDGWGPDVD